MYQSAEIAMNFPVLGIDKRRAAIGEVQHTTSNALNVRPDDTEEGRMRGGSRPGTLKAFAEQLGSGARIRHVGQLNSNVTGSAESITVFDNFDQAVLSDKWTGGTDTDDGGLDFIKGIQICDLDTSNNAIVPVERTGFDTIYEGEVIYDRVEGLDTSKAYTVSFVVTSSLEDSVESSIFIRLPNVLVGSDRDGQDSFIKAKFDQTSATQGSFLLTELHDGASNTISDSGVITHGESFPLTLTVSVDGDAIDFLANGSSKASGTATDSFTVQTGERVGLLMSEAFVAGGASSTLSCTSFSMTATVTTTLIDETRRLVAVANGELWVEDNLGVMVKDTGPATLQSGVGLQGVEHLSKYYIADYGDLQTSGIAGALNAAGTTFTVAGEDFTANFSIDTDDHVLEIFLASETTTTLGMYEISAVGTTTLTLALSATDGAQADATVSYRIARSPKVYDPALAVGSRLNHFIKTAATQGTPPAGCKLIARYRDRLCLAGDINNTHLWFQSRAGDPTDWDYFPIANDVGKAVAGQNSESGAIGDGITAQIPHSDDYMIYGSLNSMWVLVGDAVFGGSINSISRNIGMLGGDMWCYGSQSEVIFLTKDGIYSNERGIINPITSISREKIPRELLDIDPSIYQVSMEYDIAERGVFIMVSPFDETKESFHYFILWRTGSFFRAEHISDHDPFALWNYSANDADRSAVIMGCRDGYLRKYSFDANTDDGTEVKSIVSIGPQYMSTGSNREGILKYLSLDLDDDSDDIKVTIITGKNHAEAIDKANLYIAERI